MKKIIAMLLALMLVLTCFAACDSAPAADQVGESDATSDVQTDDSQTAENADSDLAFVQANGKLVVGITDYAPMDYKDENGEWTGFDAEFAQLFAKDLGVECEFYVIADWGKKFMELDTKQIDAVWNGMTITEEAKLNSNVSDPYVVNAQVLVMKADVIGNYADAASITGLTVAVENGSAGQDAASAITGVVLPVDAGFAAYSGV